MTKILQEDKYDYKLPIFYTSIKEETEAWIIGVKEVRRGYNSSLGIKIDKTEPSFYKTSQDILSSGKYILWKQLRKKYAKYLNKNPFEKGDKVICIANSSQSPNKIIGKEYIIYTSTELKIQYEKHYSATFKDFKLISNQYSLNQLKDWRDAFLEDNLSNLNWTKSIDGSSKTIICTLLGFHNKANALLAYVSSFELGGFRLSEDNKLEVLISTTSHPEIATYEHAKKFIKNFKDKEKIA